MPASSGGNLVRRRGNGLRRDRRGEWLRRVGCGITARGPEEEGTDPGARDVVDLAGKAGQAACLAPGKQRMADWLAANDQPVQYWPRPDHKDGMLDVLASVRTELNTGGLYKISNFKEAITLTSSAVGGGSMIYSGVTIEPDPSVLQQIGLNLGAAEFDAARQWMTDFRGPLNKVVTKIPLPGRDVSNLTDDDYLYLDRSRALRDAAAALAPKLGI